MSQPSKKEMLFAQIMLITSIPLGFFPPLIMFLITKNRSEFYRETSRKALNFHLTLIPLFSMVFIFELHFMYSFILLGFETIVLLNAVIKVFLNKPYSYPAIPFIRSKVLTGRMQANS
ncbi:DUF4870 domain-containing protein [Natribacillus halophilus]|uniref:DUF4870 domain-containing protein n=1 Tax=Natribacillus halophilus TaxID=549003 RepID=A0A1G8KXB5_9BACI|nr:DUF4870 domain-containing protein [Natribacillus halophilus]SDI48054.1 protein of unknown function [Natribacillus halophilus]